MLESDSIQRRKFYGGIGSPGLNQVKQKMGKLSALQNVAFERKESADLIGDDDPPEDSNAGQREH